MNQSRRMIFAMLLVLMLFPVVVSGALENWQEQYNRRFQNGLQLYNLSHWHEAAIEFRRAQEMAQNIDAWAAALYWVILSELAHSDFGSALRDMDQLERHAPNSYYAIEMIYHRARVYYILGFFEEALILFNRYINTATGSDAVTAARRAAAFFWMGESLFAMGQFDEAEKFYSWVIARYPNSRRVEASVYRIDLMRHKRIQLELLELLQLSHEEALRTSEEFRRRIRIYEHQLVESQRRIAELTNLQQPQRIEPLPPARIEPPPVLDRNGNERNDIENSVTPDISGYERFFLPESSIERAIRLEEEVQYILSEGHNGGGAR